MLLELLNESICIWAFVALVISITGVIFLDVPDHLALEIKCRVAILADEVFLYSII
jgi:hypothetical protein